MTTIAPMRFQGTEAERQANLRSHSFDPQYGRCMFCDCRPFGRVAEWPCGVEPPRVEDSTAALEFEANFHAYAAAGGTA